MAENNGNNSEKGIFDQIEEVFDNLGQAVSSAAKNFDSYMKENDIENKLDDAIVGIGKGLGEAGKEFSSHFTGKKTEQEKSETPPEADEQSQDTSTED